MFKPKLQLRNFYNWIRRKQSHWNLHSRRTRSNWDLHSKIWVFLGFNFYLFPLFKGKATRKRAVRTRGSILNQANKPMVWVKDDLQLGPEHQSQVLEGIGMTIKYSWITKMVIRMTIRYAWMTIIGIVIYKKYSQMTWIGIQETD